MYAKKPRDESVIKEPKRLLIPIFILVAAVIVLGLYPQIVFDLIKPALNQLQFIQVIP